MSIILEETIVYAARIKNLEILKNSSSGGMFTALSDPFLEQNNAVVCAKYNYQKNEVEYTLVTSKEERDLARGSKYIESKMGRLSEN